MQSIIILSSGRGASHTHARPAGMNTIWTQTIVTEQEGVLESQAHADRSWLAPGLDVEVEVKDLLNLPGLVRLFKLNPAQSDTSQYPCKVCLSSA
jgi:hypothetical protein